ncbi:MAG: protein translocase subunit SecF [Proteobacteria bacterium]|nr:protein translocase subunit SecF [Pseudomonadota bacterium]MDA1207032.1 protein translocase subunit SecF [Pseudomonadota bacterium]
MRYRKGAAWVSIAVLLVALASLSFQSLNWGLDFTGGTLVEVSYSTPVVPEQIRLDLDRAGWQGHVVQYFGSDRDILVRMPPQKNLSDRENARLGDSLFATLKELYEGDLNLRRSEFVGPAVGEELTNQGGLGLLAALGMVLLYVSFRFQFKFAVGAVVALFHDVLFTLGVFSLLRWEFDLTVLAALLAVIGYSLNDTIVVSDRIRENFRNARRDKPVELIDTSLNQTLGRTLITSITTLLVLTALALLGGELIRGFAVALIIGVLVGTYSSVYVASNVLLRLNLSREDLLVPVKEGADQDPMP